MFGYIPHPKWFTIPVIFAFTGYVSVVVDGWILFGVIVIILSIGMSFVIGIRIIIEGYKEYYEGIASFLMAVDRIHNADTRDAMLAFFGFPTNPKITRWVETSTENGEAYPEYKLPELPIPIHIMRYIADNVLTGHSFSEKQLAGKGKPISGNKFREYQKLFLEKGLAKPNNSKAKNLGISLTRKGQTIMLECASESVKKLVREGD